MRAKIEWTEQRDDLLTALRAEGATWDGIAARMRVSRWAVLERGKHLGIWRPAPAATVKPATRAMDSDPLPPGHPVSWGAITAGTWLSGQPYPYAPPIAVRAGEKEERITFAQFLAGLRLAA